jgi:DNA-binding transcriptional MocR family regulator
MDALELVARLHERGVQVASLRDYVVNGGTSSAHGVVIGYGHVSTTELAAALEVIVDELRRLDEGAARTARR